MLSKSNGLPFLLHSRSVARIAEFLAKKLLSEDYLFDNLHKIIKAALIHDIGKCEKRFQDFLMSIIKQLDIDPKDVEDLDFFHQELSWAIAMCVLNKVEYESALNSIYWHHAKPIFDEFKLNDSISNILNKITDDDINNIYDNLSILIPDLLSIDEFKLNVNKYKNSAEKTPDYYYNVDNDSNRNSIIYRSIIITSDRISSGLSLDDVERSILDDEFCEQLLDNNKEILNFTLPSHYDKARINRQLDIVNKCNENKTSVVKAPAGFGKTLIGLLWTVGRLNKLLWVCPRNIIVESVYDSILEEIKNIGLENKISVELFLTGKRQKSTNPEIKVFQSDIVVTNIDNFLSPIAKNRFGLWSADILKRDVVFDEYHEFICDSALFSGFIEIMTIRHNIVKCNTVLLSATPSLYHILWDNRFSQNKTKILPNNNSHYPAAHTKPYNIGYIEEGDLINEKNSLIMTNSIHNSQLKKKELGIEVLVHSNFLDEDRIKIFEKIFDNYKKGSQNNDKPSVVSAPIIQASMDISFWKINVSVLSPEALLQVIGRCGRWGEYLELFINLFKIVGDGKQSEQTAINMLYDKELNILWCKYIEDKIVQYNSKMLLDDLYIIYNEFNIKYDTEIINYINTQYKLSLSALSKISPIKYSISKKEIGFKKQIAKIRLINKINDPDYTLRTNNGNSIFVIYRRDGSSDDEYDFVGPFSVNLRGIPTDRFFNEDDNFTTNIKRVVKKMVQNGKFNYPKRFSKEFYPSTLLKYAKDRNDVPYVAFDKKYSSEYGLAKLSIFENE